ncbi:MAG: peptide ABC transporter substrate-binding protein, partial [Rhabdochlamydiaceae bacterium]
MNRWIAVILGVLALPKRRFFNLCGYIILLCLTGCHSTESSSKSPHILRINISREPPTMDPRKGNEWIGSAMHYMLFEGLMRLNPNGTLTPAQARSVEISDDRMTYIFHLRGAHWSDGSIVTAQDFELAWKKIIDPQFGATSAYLLYPIKNAEKVKRGELPVDQVGISSKDDLTLVVQLEKPTPYFLDLISFCLFFPVNHTMDEKNPEWMLNASSQFISNGPFTLKTWKHNREIVFEKNNEYWEAPLIDLDQVHVSMIGDENTALSMYENGQLDIIGMVASPLPTDALRHFYEQGVLKNQSAPATTIVSFNTSRFPFTNKHIRKAFSYAIDRPQIVKNITQLGEEVATNLIPPCLALGESNAFFQAHNPVKAQEEFRLGLSELGIHKLPKV